MDFEEENELISAMVEAIVVLREHVPSDRRNEIGASIPSEILKVETVMDAAILMLPYAPTNLLVNLRRGSASLPVAMVKAIDDTLLAKAGSGMRQ